MSKEQFLKEHQKEGELYAGIILDPSGDYHLFLLPGEAVDVSWDKARAWATRAGGDLPTRREQSLLFANLKGEFQPKWYWSGEQHAAYAGYAWTQGFVNGTQSYGRKSYGGRARAVRRLMI